ncbi:hypothetical protein [Tunturiibacter empetritectus]|uniref:hypothetical protein n=1 Tax=Tunturiibacter empetritectus TaxID=3069691 RepID=UPI003D9BC307
MSGLFDLHGVLLAGADLPVGGVPVGQAATADVAGSYGVDVVFATGLDVGLHVLAGGWEAIGFVFSFDRSRGVLTLFGRGGGVAGDGLLGGDVGGDGGVDGSGLSCRLIWGAGRGCGGRLRGWRSVGRGLGLSLRPRCDGEREEGGQAKVRDGSHVGSPGGPLPC